MEVTPRDVATITILTFILWPVFLGTVATLIMYIITKDRKESLKTGFCIMKYAWAALLALVLVFIIT